MNSVAAVALGVVGGAAIVATVISAVRTTVLPRASGGLVVRSTLIVSRFAFRLWVGRTAKYERRDRVMAMYGPIAIFALLGSWLLIIVGAFSLLYLATGVRTLSRALAISGSSVFTLGTTVPHGSAPIALSDIEAASGLLIVTLVITYLPSIYGAFSRREAGVNLLRVRAGNPPKASSLLIRYHRIDPSSERLTELWQTWEGWFADVEETHSTFQILPFFRSPQPNQSWINAAGVILDSASMWLAAVEHDPDPDAQLCIRAGFQTLKGLAMGFGMNFDADPRPDDPISISRAEWDASVDALEAAGVPVKPDRDEAWKAWAGWRVNYDAVLLEFARVIEAPPAPWVSDRSPVSHRPSKLKALRKKSAGLFESS